MKRYFIFCIMVWYSHILYSQNIITGKIVDTENMPLPGASVILPEMNKGTIAGSDGTYKLFSLPHGSFKIQFSFLGYNTEIKTVTLNGNPVELNITLHTSIISTEEVVISGGFNSTQHENAVKIDVLKLEHSEIKSTPNFMEVLTKIPGVDMITKGIGVSKPVIRGLSMNDVLVLNNGVRFENYQYSSHHPLGIDEFGLETVEIIKGPASLLYGSDAIGGVLNFIKEKPAPVGHIIGDYNAQYFSNSKGFINNLGIKGSSGNIFAGIRVGHKTNADYLQGGGEYVPNSRFNEYSLKTNVGFTGKTGTFKVYYDYNRQNLGLVEDEAVETISRRGRNTQIFYQQLSTHLLSSQNKLYLGKTRLEINSAYQNTELIHFGEENTSEIQMRLGTFTYETKINIPIGNNNGLITGIQGMHQHNTNVNEREVKLLPNSIINNYSGFALLYLTFFEKLRCQAGIRYDIKDLSTKAIINVDSTGIRPELSKKYRSSSGSLGITYNISEQLLFRGNIAAAYRTPNLAELTSNGPHEIIYEVGNQNLVPENSYEADISSHFHLENITLDIAGFYNSIRNYIFISPTGESTPEGLPVYQYKQNGSALFGGEIGFHIHPKKYKWLHIETTFSHVTGKQNNGVYLPFIPASKFNFEIRAEKEKLAFLEKVYISVNNHNAFSQDNAAPDETKTPGYSLFDITTGGTIHWSKQPIFISVGMNNIFDKKYIDHLSTLKEVHFFNPGRNVFLTIRIPFGVITPE